MGEIKRADIVLSTAGRDSGRAFAVLSAADGYAVIADGRLRRVEHPKRKKQGHLKKLGECGGSAGEKLSNEETPTNKELWHAVGGYIVLDGGDRDAQG